MAKQSQVNCSVHGRQDLAYVCRHIVATLDDETPSGFFWNFVDGAFEAVCESCNAMTEAEAMAQGPGLISAVCFGCFRDAAAINGVDLD